MELQVVDARPPFAVAFAALSRPGPAAEKTQDDLAALVAELARKYFGISSEIMVETALRGALALVNEGILLSSDGPEAPASWPQVLREKDILGLCSATTALIKNVAKAEVIRDLEPEAAVSRRILWEFFRQNETAGWRAAHRFLLTEESAAQKEMLLRELATWLEKHTTVGRVLKMKRRESRDDSSLADEIVNYILPRCCGIPAAQLDAFRIAELMTDEDEPMEDFSFGESIILPEKIFKTAKKKYAEFAATIPTRLQPALSYDGKDWFERFVATTPEKKKKPAPKAKAAK